MDSDSAELLHLRVGDILPIGIYTNKQTTEAGYHTDRQTPVRRINVKVVGIVTFPFEVVRDDFDRSLPLSVFSPALTNPLIKCCANGVISGLQLEHGARDDAVVEAEIKKALPDHEAHQSHDRGRGHCRAGGRTPCPSRSACSAPSPALAALLIAGQAIGRQLRAGGDELDALPRVGSRARR